MKRFVAVALMAGLSCLTACDRTSADPDRSEGRTDASVPRTNAAASGQNTAPLSERGSPAQPIVDGAPAFAVLYPGGQLEAPATVASSSAGPGGLVAFRTDADPDTIVAFYREKAEAAGLSSVMAMNMGEARSYGAAKADAGANLQVVASPVEGGQTSVQLSWSAG